MVDHRWVEIKTRDIKEGEKIIEIHGIARDITENIILKQKLKKSYNAHQLAKAMNMDYKTVRHHLNVLINNGIIRKKVKTLILMQNTVAILFHFSFLMYAFFNAS